MKNKTNLIIAGTSTGGSSYTLRIMNALKNDFSKDLTIRVGKGPAQQAVHTLILKRVVEIHQFVNQVGGSIKQNIVVVKE